jgi:hypothetical protein
VNASLDSAAQRAVVANVKQAVPFFGVRNIDASLRFNVDGLNFTKTHQWAPEGRIRWRWLEYLLNTGLFLFEMVNGRYGIKMDPATLAQGYGWGKLSNKPSQPTSAADSAQAIQS